MTNEKVEARRLDSDCVGPRVHYPFCARLLVSAENQTTDEEANIPALDRALEAYATAWQLSLDLNQTSALRAAHRAEALRASADILELLD
jgi:hypothetical protein